MSAEELIYSRLSSLVAGRVYPDAAPNGATRPFIVYRQLGGTSAVFMDNTLPSKEHGHFEIGAYTATRLAAKSLIKQVESLMVSSVSFIAQPIAASRADAYVDDNLYEAVQDFSVWSDRD